MFNGNHNDMRIGRCKPFRGIVIPAFLYLENKINQK